MPLRISRDAGVLLVGSGAFTLFGLVVGSTFIAGLCAICFALVAIEFVATRGRLDD